MERPFYHPLYFHVKQLRIMGFKTTFGLRTWIERSYKTQFLTYFYSPGLRWNLNILNEIVFKDGIYWTRLKDYVPGRK